jgi:hypothetical protein
MDDNQKGWILVLGILAVVALAAFATVFVIYRSIQQTVRPVQEMTGNVSTQVAVALNPTATILPDPVTVIRDVRSLARLETIQYSVEKVIRAETNQDAFGVLFGDKLIFVAHGQVIAGIDLSKMSPNDLHLENGVLYVKLPEPEVFITSIDNEKSYVYDRQTGLLTKGDINLESQARRAAEDEVEKAAREDGILKLAQQNAETYLERLFNNLGYPQVIFEGGIQVTPTTTK